MVYADYNATSPVSDAVFQKMKPYLLEEFGNPSNVKGSLGQRAKAAIETAREELALLLGAKPEEVYFCSGGTEASFQALHGLLGSFDGERRIAYSAIEHPCVSEAVITLKKLLAAEASCLPVNDQGELRLESIDQLASVRPSVASIMLANNETGVLQPLAEIATRCRQKGILLHSDAVQAVGKIPVSFAELGVDALSISAHKFGGPKGVGAFVLREGVPFTPLVRGGSQEKGYRGGTEAVALIVGMGEAARESKEFLAQGGGQQLKTLRDSLERQLLQRFPEARISSINAERLPNTCNISLPGILGSLLVERLAEREVYVSAGAACKAADGAASQVLTAMGLEKARALGSLRISLGRNTSEGEIHRLLEQLEQAVLDLRAQLATKE